MHSGRAAVDFLWKTNWHDLFVPEMSLPEVLLRGGLVYVSLCLLLRVILKRQAGKVSLNDLLVITLVAGVSRNPLVRDTKSIPDGLMIVAMVLFTSYAVDWLSYRVPALRKFLQSPPVPLIRNGRVLDENLNRELITHDQLNSQLRQEGVHDPAEVEAAFLEGSGKISVIKKETPDGGAWANCCLSPEAPAAQTPPPPGEQNGHAAGDGPPRPAELGEPDVARFLESVRRLQERVSYHRQQAADHEGAARRLEEVLKGQGVRLPAARRDHARRPHPPADRLPAKG
jgi:uncharacterized membrane protein YcaP (DUF421 family)